MNENEKYDIIIIGGGLGGLTAGAKLAKEGNKILVIEQHSKVGGCATIFHRKVKGKTITLEVGLHMMNGLDREDDFKRDLFRELGVFDNVEFIKVPEFYRFTNGRYDVVVPQDIEKAISSLSEAFPKEINAIETFFNDISHISSAVGSENMPELLKFSTLSVGEYFDNLTKNEDLKMVLTANLGYYHDDPYGLSIIFFSVPQDSFFTGGGHFIKGGSQVLSDYLGTIITKNGGDIILNHLVTEIITEDDTAIGVKYIHKKREDLPELLSFAKIIIANAAMPNVVNKLLGEKLKNSEYAHKVNSFKISCSLYTVYLAFSQPPSTIGNKCFSTFIYDENIKTLKAAYNLEQTADYSKKGFVFTDYSIFDSQLEGYIGALCGIDHLEHWDQLSATDYNNKKQELKDTLINRLDKVIPGIKDIIIYSEVATPKTIVRYTQNPQGTVYGFAQTPTQIGPLKSDIKKPPIKNLYYASAWVGSGGFSGAIYSGYSCALKVLKDMNTE
ncbi:MAG: phytoene desaturase family protein [Candidatus Hodarchaeota archaeon]